MKVGDRYFFCWYYFVRLAVRAMWIITELWHLMAGGSRVCSYCFCCLFSPLCNVHCNNHYAFWLLPVYTLLKYPMSDGLLDCVVNNYTHVHMHRDLFFSLLKCWYFGVCGNQHSGFDTYNIHSSGLKCWCRYVTTWLMFSPV